jgi:hypothetical protein
MVYICRVHANGQYDYQQHFYELEKAEAWSMKQVRIAQAIGTGWDTVYSVSIYSVACIHVTDFINLTPIKIISPA